MNKRNFWYYQENTIKDNRRKAIKSINFYIFMETVDNGKSLMTSKNSISFRSNLVSANYFLVPVMNFICNYGKALFSFFILWNIAFTALSQDKTSFENPIILGEREGLDARYIYSTAVDKSGFVWIATDQGLYRYDGTMFIKYSNQLGDSTSLISNNVRHLYFDEDTNQLWISTWETAKGLSILDLDTYKFKNYYYNEKVRGGITGHGIFWTYKDKFDQYWVSTRGLAKYVSNEDTFRRVTYEINHINNQIKPGSVNKMISYSQDQYNDSLLWLGTDAGLLKFNVITEKFKHFPIVDFSGSGYTLRTIHHHTDNKVYLGTWSAGLYTFDPIAEKFSSIPFFDGYIIKGQARNKIQKIKPKNDHTLWVKTYDGLLELNTKNLKVVNKLTHNFNKQEIFGVDYIDPLNRKFTWAHNTQTEHSSLYIYAPGRQQLKTYIKYGIDKKFDFLPRRILEDKSKNGLWITAQNSEGLYFLDLNENKWETIPPPSQYFIKKNATFQGWDLLRTSDEKLLILDGRTIYEYAENDQILSPWNMQPTAINPGYRRFIEDNSGNIWIGTRNEGIFKINPDSGIIDHFDEEMIDDKKRGTGEIVDLQKDRNGNIWIRSSGYSVYDLKNDTFHNFAFFFPDEQVVRHIQALGIDKNGNTWISTTSNGLVNAIGITDADHPESGIVKYYMMGEQLKSNKTEEFFLDNNRDLWLLSKDLEKISTDGKSLAFYSDQMMNKKDLNTAVSLSDGQIAIGFRGGIGLFKPDSLHASTHDLFPYVHSLSIYNRDIIMDPFQENTEPIKLKPKENFFGLQVSAINPQLYGDIEFQYQMEGVDKDWVNIKNQTFINYTDVKSGDYIFNLRARNQGSHEWGQNVYQLKIHIYKKWYLTNLAYIVYFLLLSFIIFRLYKFVLTKKLIQQEALRLQELNEFKARFYDNITHEFRTPLTVISGLSQDMEEKLDSPDKQKLKLIQKNSNKILNLVNQILALSKLRAGKENVQYIQGEIIGFIRYIVLSHYSLANSKKISINFKSFIDEISMDFDREKLELIVTNLISNAIKYTQKGGHINVNIIKRGKFLQLNVKDSGIGINEQEIPHIFDRFHRSTNKVDSMGSGLGLAMVKECVQLLGGIISVQSKPDKGSIFSISLPIHRNAPLQQTFLPQDFKNILKGDELHPEIALTEHENAQLVLLVEDNQDVAYYISECLSQEYKVIHCENGKIGLEKARELIPDIIITDLMMPEIDGFEFCQQIKTDEPTNHIPIIMLTAKASKADLLKGLSKGADAYLTKPFDKTELKIRIEKLLELRKTLQDRYMQNDELSSSKTTEKPEVHPFLMKVEKIIEENLDNENLSINEVANHLHLSTSQVYRKIKALSGKSTAIYIRHVRLTKAKAMLGTPDLTISEVAYQTGFRSPAYFSQSFKDTFGHSPSDFIKSNFQKIKQ